MQNMFCSGTSTFARGNAGRLCMVAAVETETASLPDKSATVGVEQREVLGSTNHITDEIYCHS